MNLYIGTSGYAYREWKGKFYPKELPAARMLNYYSERFRAVEINSSFYQMPTANALKAWTNQVPKTFTFVLKAPQQITHRQRLKNSGETLKQFVEVAATLKKRQGPLLFQLPPNMKKDLPRLHDFLSLLPPRCRAAFEFRHQSWFDDEVFELLRKHKAALCIADADNDLKVPRIATARWGYLRLRRADYRDAELKRWAKWIQAQKWRDAFVFFKHEDEATGPDFASRLTRFIK